MQYVISSHIDAFSSMERLGKVHENVISMTIFATLL